MSIDLCIELEDSPKELVAALNQPWRPLEAENGLKYRVIHVGELQYQWIMQTLRKAVEEK